MARFDLTEVLKGRPSIFEDVPDPGTREQIEYIDMDRIDDDPRNFYELSGIEELASNIALCGLQQPVRVRDGEDGRVIIVSGHRRRAALRLLLEEGAEQWKRVPCIRQPAAKSEALQELQLIYANSDTRRMTAAELARQAERVEALLYRLKEEGHEFPGRMRDHVAQVCQVSKTKLGNLKVIREGLLPNLKPAWERGELNETTALLLARQPENVQRKMMAKYGRDLHSMTAEQIEKAAMRADAPESPESKQSFGFSKTESEKYLKELREEDERFSAAMKTYGYDLLIDCVTGKPSRRDGIEALKKGPGFSHRGGSNRKFDYQCMPNYFAIRIRQDPEIKRSWTEVWDAMAVIALERTRKTDTAAEDEATANAAADDWSGWGCGHELPAESGLYFCISGPLDIGGKLFWWNADAQQWEHPGIKFKMTPTVKAWIKCPALPESIRWNRSDG